VATASIGTFGVGVAQEGSQNRNYQKMSHSIIFLRYFRQTRNVQSKIIEKKIKL